MFALLNIVLFVQIAAILSVLFWSAGGPWFLVFAWSAIAAAAWYQIKHPYLAAPPKY